MGQRLRLCTSNAEGVGSIPGWGAKIPRAMQCDKEAEKIIRQHILLPGGLRETSPGAFLLNRILVLLMIHAYAHHCPMMSN